eukprot:m.45773 g.45773  ORF g.45773 m.45773 type:complete len:764 (-) comp7235_c3_seq1:359-2650(-)
MEKPASTTFRRNGLKVHQKRKTLGMHRSANFLKNNQNQENKALSWIQLIAFVLLDVITMGVAATIWFFAGIFLWFFSHIHDYLLVKLVGISYLYNVSWEDPRVDRTALDLSDDDHVITIASACDNVLDFMIDGARVTAVDLNNCQLALCELKRAAILELNFQDFFAIFAEQNIPLLKEKFETLKNHMTSDSINFWENSLKSGFKSFMYSGSSGWLAYALFRVLFPVIGFGWVRKSLLDGVDNELFHENFEKHKTTFEWVAWIADSVLVPICAPLAGVPAAQLDLGNDREGNVASIIHRVFGHTDLVNDNYFFTGYILGHYTKKCCPRYLKEEHYSTLKAAIKANKLELYHGTLANRFRLDARQEKPPVYTAAVMLDHLDWMDDYGVNEELSLLWPLLHNEKGRVLWRSFSHSPHRAALKWMKSIRVDNGTNDRTGMYWGVWYAKKSDCGNHPELTSEGLFWEEQEPQTFVEKLVTGATIVSFPIMNMIKKTVGDVSQRLPGATKEDLNENQHAQKIEAFYKSQARAYDAFRENFLHARKHFASCLPLSNNKIVWIDVGAGTARNLEFFPINTLKRRFEKIYILDISPSLLEIAQERVEKAGLSDLVELVLADFTDLSEVGMAALPKAHSADIITFSYSLSMIPDKDAALAQAMRLLKPDGAIGIADFFAEAEKMDDSKPISNVLSTVYDTGCRLWFKQDGVHLLPNDRFDVLAENGIEAVCSERFRGSVPLLPILRPWHGIWIGRKGGLIVNEQIQDKVYSDE